MPATDPALDAIRIELSEAIEDLEEIRGKTVPHIHVREQIHATWDSAFSRIRRARDRLYRRAHAE